MPGVALLCMYLLECRETIAFSHAEKKKFRGLGNNRWSFVLEVLEVFFREHT